MNNKQFKVGDRVTFKTWAEMAEEFGLRQYDDGMAYCQCGFSCEMTSLCGTQATITEIYNGYGILLKDFSAEGGDEEWANLWTYDTDMIKHTED